jgi:hypothetical protein
MMMPFDGGAFHFDDDVAFVVVGSFGIDADDDGCCGRYRYYWLGTHSDCGCKKSLEPVAVVG